MPKILRSVQVHTKNVHTSIFQIQDKIKVMNTIIKQKCIYNSWPVHSYQYHAEKIILNNMIIWNNIHIIA